MVVAVAAVRMVQVAVDEVVDVIAMRDCFVTAVGTVHVVGIMRTACVVRRARSGIGSALSERVLVDVVPVNVVKVTLVQVVDVTVVGDRGVSTTVAVLVGMLFVSLATHVRSLPRPSTMAYLDRLR